MKYLYLMIAGLLLTGCTGETDLQEFLRIKETCERQSGVLGKTKETWVGRYGQTSEYDAYTCTLDGKFVVKMK